MHTPPEIAVGRCPRLPCLAGGWTQSPSLPARCCLYLPLLPLLPQNCVCFINVFKCQLLFFNRLHIYLLLYDFWINV